MIGEPAAGKPPVRFDEGVQETYGNATRLRPTLRGLLISGACRLGSILVT